MALSGCPGCGQIGPFTLRPLTSISTMSPVSSPDFFAWLGLISTALSQQRFVIGFGRLLQPGVVGAAAVVDHRIAAEHHFHLAPGSARWSAECCRPWPQPSSPATPCWQISRRSAPCATSCRSRPSSRPASTCGRCRSRRLRRADEREDEFVLALAVIQRRDQRLDERSRSVEGRACRPTAPGSACR